jgi:hypothetical protein
MAGKIIVSTLQSDTDNSISFVANTGATIFSANISHGIAGSFIGAGSITGDKIGQNAISSNNIVSVNASVATVGTLPTARLPLGTVLQVVSATKTDTFSTSSSSWTDITGLSVSITPTSSSSKILVMYNLMTGETISQFPLIRLVRGSTAIAVGDAAGSRAQVSSVSWTNGSNNVANMQSMNFLDSPSTTSSITYKLQTINTQPETVYVNRNARDSNVASEPRGVSSITVMEIAA